MGGNMSAGRRDFLKMTTAGAAGIALTSRVETVFASSSAIAANSPLNKWPGRVVVNFNKAAVTTSGADTTVIEQMVNDAIQKLTSQTTIGAAWKALFPATLTATSKIAIKVNTANTGLPAPHWSSVRAITDGLQQMDFNGTKFPAANITLYDMNASNLSSAKFTAANFPGINLVNDTAVNGGDGAINNRTYAQSLKNAAFLINVFSPRGHTLPPTGSKFTLGFKSHFGTYSNPGGLHANVAQNLADINCTGPVFNKNVLSVCSGIYGMNEGSGPTGNVDIYTTYAQSIDKTSTNQCPTTIILSTDPIAAEMQSIKMMRINKNGAYAVADMPPYLQASAGMTPSGFSTTYNIGTIDESKMTVIKIINGASTPVLNPVSDLMDDSRANIVAHHIKGHNATFIEFKLPGEHVGSSASVEIFDNRGALVRKFSQKVLGVQNHFSWDEISERGGLVSKGTYIVHLISGPMSASAPFTIVR